jgi:hypothetical protein
MMRSTVGPQIILNPFDFEESSVFRFLICKFLVLSLRSERILIYYNISQKLQVTILEIGILGKVV